MTAAETQAYWDERAQLHPETATTNDLCLRDLEFRILSEHIGYIKPWTVLDVGCGDGLTTIRLARQFPGIRFTGIDYAQGMVGLAGQNLGCSPDVKNVKFRQLDLFQLDTEDFECVITCRVLINLPNWRVQRMAIEKLQKAARRLLLIENFIEPHSRLNGLREKCGLPPIAVRPHNCFLVEKKLRSAFGNTEIIPFASTYYALTRVFYSRLAKDSGEEPRYDHACHKTAANMLDWLRELDVAPMKLIRV